MKYQVRRFGIIQTAKLLGVLYALMGLLLSPFFLADSLFGGEGSYGLAFALLMPPLYGLLGFVMSAIGNAARRSAASRSCWGIAA